MTDAFSAITEKGQKFLDRIRVAIGGEAGLPVVGALLVALESQLEAAPSKEVKAKTIAWIREWLEIVSDDDPQGDGPVH